MNAAPGVAKLAAVLPATERGKRNTVSTLPACVVPPTAVRLFARSAGRPAGTVASTIAGNVVEPDANARSATAPTAIDTYCVAVKFARPVAVAGGSAEFPPLGDVYTSTVPAPALKTRSATCAPG